MGMVSTVGRQTDMTDDNFTVCALCGKELAQPHGTPAIKHGHVYGPTMCDGWGISVMWASDWRAWRDAPVDDWDL